MERQLGFLVTGAFDGTAPWFDERRHAVRFAKATSTHERARRIWQEDESGSPQIVDDYYDGYMVSQDDGTITEEKMREAFDLAYGNS